MFMRRDVGSVEPEKGVTMSGVYRKTSWMISVFSKFGLSGGVSERDPARRSGRLPAQDLDLALAADVNVVRVVVVRIYQAHRRLLAGLLMRANEVCGWRLGTKKSWIAEAKFWAGLPLDVADSCGRGQRGCICYATYKDAMRRIVQ